MRAGEEMGGMRKVSGKVDDGALSAVSLFGMSFFASCFSRSGF